MPVSNVFTDDAKVKILHTLHMNGMSVKDMRDHKQRGRITGCKIDGQLKISRKMQGRAETSVKALGKAPFVDVVKNMMKDPNIGGDIVNAIVAGKKVTFTTQPIQPKATSYPSFLER